MMFPVLKTYMPMVGIPWIEQHQAVFPPVMAPVPKVPHLCAAMLCVGPWGAITGKPNPKEISAGWGAMLSQGTDIGPLIPHYNLTPPAPPNALIPIMLLTSGSKSHFGAHSHVAPQGPVAFACAFAVNFNLNCGGPAFPPMPSGVVLAFTTHRVGVTIGDLVAGLLHLGFDLLIQFALNRIFTRAGPTELGERVAQGLVSKLIRPLTGFNNISALVERGLGTWVGAAVEETFFALPLTLVSVFVTGSPVGYSPGYSPVGGSDHPWTAGTYTDKGHTGVQKAVDNLFNSPSVEQHPSAPPPAPAASGTPTTTPAPTGTPAPAAPAP